MLATLTNVWGFLHGNKLSAGVWDSYEEIVDACAEAWNWLMADPDRIRSIGTREWATVVVQAGWYNYVPQMNKMS